MLSARRSRRGFCPPCKCAAVGPTRDRILAFGTPTSYDLEAYREGLKEAGYVEGQNLAIEYRFANDDPFRLSELASDLVRSRVRVIVAVASGLAVRAAKDATNAIPVVFGYGNITGVISLAEALYGKQLGIMHELLPHAIHFGVLANPNSTLRELIVKDTQTAASALGLTVEILDAGSDDDIDALFKRLGEEKQVQAMLITNDPFFIGRRERLAALAARYALPSIYPFREMAEAGGLLSYGPSLASRDRQAALYVARILKGESPADLPVVQVNKFELVINQKVAKALGLSFPNSMQLLVDEGGAERLLCSF